MTILRIVVTGSVGAGKTSFIRTISEIEVVDTDKRSTDEIAQIKETTTVGFDFGRITLAQNQVLHLYGTPGQTRFDFMWDILSKLAHAYILLIDAHRPLDLDYAGKIIEFINQKEQARMIIGITHADRPGALQLEDVARALGLIDVANRPCFVLVNPTEKTSVYSSLLVLCNAIAKNVR